MVHNDDAHPLRFHGDNSLFVRIGGYSRPANLENSVTTCLLSARMARQRLGAKQCSTMNLSQSCYLLGTGVQNELPTLRTSSSMSGLSHQCASGAKPRFVSSARSSSARLERSRPVSVVPSPFGHTSSFQSQVGVDHHILVDHNDDSCAKQKRLAIACGQAPGFKGEGPLQSARRCFAGTATTVATPPLADFVQYPNDAPARSPEHDNRNRQARSNSPMIVRRQSASNRTELSGQWLLSGISGSVSTRLACATPPKANCIQPGANVVRFASAPGHQDRHVRSPSPLILRRRQTASSVESSPQSARDYGADSKMRNGPPPMAKSRQTAAVIQCSSIDSAATCHMRSESPRRESHSGHHCPHERSPSPLVVRRRPARDSIVDSEVRSCPPHMSKSWHSAADVTQSSPVDSQPSCHMSSENYRSVSPSIGRHMLQPIGPYVASAFQQWIQQQVQTAHQGTSQSRFRNCEDGGSEAYTINHCMPTSSLDAIQKVACGELIPASGGVATELPVAPAAAWAAAVAIDSPLNPLCGSETCNSSVRQGTQRTCAQSSTAFCESSKSCCPLSDAPAQDWKFESRHNHNGSIEASNVANAEAITQSQTDRPRDVHSSWHESDTSLETHFGASRQPCETKHGSSNTSLSGLEDFEGGDPERHTLPPSGSAQSHMSLPVFVKRRPAFTSQISEGPYTDTTSQSTTSPEAAASPASSVPSSPDLPTPRTCRIVSLRSLECTSVDVS